MIKKSELSLVSIDETKKIGIPKEYVFEGEDKVGAPLIANIVFDKMRELDAVSLSAPQLGLNFRMFVMGTDDIRVNVFNPEIIEYSKETVTLDETSLSHPGISMKIKRPEKITARFYDDQGKLCELKVSGMTARIFQHAYDFMIGKDFTSHVTAAKLDYTKRKYKNLKNKLVKKYTNKILTGRIGK